MFIWWNHFNTSHVTVYPRLLALKRNQNSDFNTSHVTVYLVVDNNLPKSRKFQSISCYGLSRDNEWILGRYHVFQYISCYGLSLRICSITGICRHFNTSHVTVYRNQIDPNTGLDIFQYISCYGLSVEERKALLQKLSFQYISCYGLSLRILCTRDCCTSFQYISCYGLSKEKTTGKTALVISIHLMLRFIPRNYITLDQIRRISIHLMLRFIVDIIKDLLCQADISIHLMLRFIQMFLLSVQLFQPFQYISCYGLSASVLQSQTLYHDFNTSHVTVYRQIRAAPFGMWIFQYISCYGLSRYQDTVNSILELFQYISCYGLSSPS